MDAGARLEGVKKCILHLATVQCVTEMRKVGNRSLLPPERKDQVDMIVGAAQVALERNRKLPWVQVSGVRSDGPGERDPLLLNAQLALINSGCPAIIVDAPPLGEGDPYESKLMIAR